MITQAWILDYKKQIHNAFKSTDELGDSKLNDRCQIECLRFDLFIFGYSAWMSSEIHCRTLAVFVSISHLSNEVMNPEELLREIMNAFWSQCQERFFHSCHLDLLTSHWRPSNSICPLKLYQIRGQHVLLLFYKQQYQHPFVKQTSCSCLVPLT